MSDKSLWINTDEREPDDEQIVLAWWPNDPLPEVLVYYAADAPDGPAAWRDEVGDKMDRPGYWMPIPKPPK